MRALTVAAAAALLLLPAVPAWAADDAPVGESVESAVIAGGEHDGDVQDDLPPVTALATTQLPPTIEGGWAEIGGEQGPLGDPVGGIVQLFDGGVKQLFEGGAVFWSASGSHAVHGPIWQAASWGSVGPGRLGYPIAGQVCGLRDGGCLQEFQRGAIYWSPASEAHMVVGGIRDVWARQGWEFGQLGYPVGNEGFWAGAYRQNFQGGSIAIGAPGPGDHLQPVTGPVPTAQRTDEV